MFNAQQGFDRMLFDFEQEMQANRHDGELRSLEEQLTATKRSLSGAGVECARLQALLGTVETALGAYEPGHALLRDASVREAVCEKGAETFRAGSTLKQVSQMARTMSVPGANAVPAPYSEMVKALNGVNALVDQLNATVTQLEKRYNALLDDTIRHRAQRAAFRYELSRLAPKHPLVQDAALRQRVSDAGLSAWAYTVAMPDRRWEAVDLAGTTFMITYKPAVPAPGGARAESPSGDQDEMVHELDVVPQDDSWVPDGPEEPGEVGQVLDEMPEDGGSHE
jgi:hypothetical protein